MANKTAREAWKTSQGVRAIMSKTKEYTKEQLEKMTYQERHEIIQKLKDVINENN